ncbi:MAG TPA: Ig-like domain-containing protein [Gemmatimonadaceae bacterium]|nr:Ig-like domain-containing protein [Gemmatimonadaceae bacterium]
MHVTPRWHRVAPRIPACAALVTTIIAVACGLDSTGTVGPPVASVTVDPSQVMAAVDSVFRLHATVAGEDGTPLDDRMVFWDVSDPTIASVSADGVVTTHAPGVTRVAASAEGVAGFADVAVVPARVQTVQVDPSSATLTPQEEMRFTAQPRDVHGNALTGRSITWSSSNDRVARVSADGTVHARFPGSAIITAACEGVTGSAAVAVTILKGGGG